TGKPSVVTGSSVIINAGQTKELQIPITAPATPNSYYALLQFVDAHNIAVSTLGEYRFVVTGESAMIMPIRLPALQYSQGQGNTIEVDYVGAPDAQTVTNGSLEATIRDSHGIVASAFLPNILLNDRVYLGNLTLKNSRDITANP